MKFRFEGNISDIMPGVQLLLPELGIEISEDGIPVHVEGSKGDLEVGFEGSQAYIRYGRKHQFFRGLGLLIQHSRKSDSFHIQEKQQFDNIGPMFDLSRNAVLTVDSFKLMLNKMALMGMSTVMLYMEDTYEIADEPYFGYMRGRYSHEELKEIDDYADQFGIEAFPSIQTLAHLEEFLKWEPVRHYKDTKGALLVGSEQTHSLIERMIDAASAPFRSKKIHDTALQVCKKEGIREVYATMWGDDGNEGNPFAALLGLQLYAEHAYTEEKPTQAGRSSTSVTAV
ncbi:hypothetical protein [Paenibacillus sp. FF9]|uniref:hypothetical protein n=1 Tax=Paenibacillus dakarensis TaxID=1527293 RepID=UPI0006D541F5